MKWITVSKGVPFRFHVLPLMDALAKQSIGLRWHVVVHDQDSADLLGRIGVRSDVRSYLQVHVSNTVPPIPQAGAAVQREWAENNLLDMNEWYATIDDNVQVLRGLDRAHWPSADKLSADQAKELRKEMFAPISAYEAYRRTEELVDRCIDMGAVTGAFAFGDNAMFLTRHWREIGYACARWSVRKKVGIPWRPWPEVMFEDFVQTVQAVAQYGCSPVDNWTSTWKKPFEDGGIGKLKDRIPHLTHDCNMLMTNFPGLVRPIKGREWSLMFAKTNAGQVAKWRQSRSGIIHLFEEDSE